MSPQGREATHKGRNNVQRLSDHGEQRNGGESNRDSQFSLSDKDEASSQYAHDLKIARE